MEKERSVFVKVLIAILKGIKCFFKGLYTFFYSIRFIAYIPLMTICAGIIGFLGVSCVKTLLGLVLPVSMNNGFVETFLIAIIFVGLNVYIFTRKLDEDLGGSWKKGLILNYIPVIICMVLCVFVTLDDFSLNSLQFILEGDIYDPEALDEIYTLLYPFYFPHLWLGCLAKEFLWTTPICLFINCGVSFGICYTIGVRRDKGL